MENKTMAYRLATLNMYANPKKGDAKECSNHRTIALISQAGKMMLKVLQQRLLPYMEQEMPDVQAGFWKGRGKQDLIAIICWLLECSKEFQKVSLCFIDYSKAFDCMDREKLCAALKETGAPQRLIVLMHNLYYRQEATVRTEYGETEWFPIGKVSDKGTFYLSIYLICVQNISYKRLG